MSRTDRETPKPGPDSDWYAKCDEIEKDFGGTPSAGGQIETVNMPPFRLSDKALREIEEMQREQRGLAATDTTTFD